MSSRRKRIDKVKTLREEALDKKLTELGQQRAREAAARQQEQARQQEVDRASESRRKLAEEPLTATSWIEANEWLNGRRIVHEKARVATAMAERETAKAQAQVLAARTDLKKIELLSTKIRVQETQTRERIERRLEDELSALRFRTQGDPEK